MSDVEKKENSEKPQNKQFNNQKRGNYQNRGQQQDKRRVYMRRKICRFCADKSMVIDFKKPDVLRRFTTEGGKIIPRRMSGNCAKHQRLLAKEIKISRYMALLPYVKQ